MPLFDFRLGPRIRAVAGQVSPLRPGSIALLGADHADLRPDLKVAEGAAVTAGQVLFTARRQPSLAFVALASGRVRAITLAPGRRLSALVIDLDPEEPPVPPFEAPRVSDAASMRQLLLERGLWPALRSRPFGRTPAPDAPGPAAIFVNAMACHDGAPDPAAFLPEAGEDIALGLSHLAFLTEGPVFACLPSGLHLPEAPGPRVKAAHFAPRQRSSMTSHHIAVLHGPTAGRPVWTIGWQEVVAIGRLMRTGQYSGERIVALTGQGGADARLVRTTLGAALSDLLPDGTGAPMTRMSGPVIGGREADWLLRHDTQVTTLPSARRPGQGPALRPILPTAALDRAAPLGLPAVPLARALAVGDLEMVERLGGGDLVEEDVARLSHACTSGSDYGALLRRMLTMMEEAA